MFQVQNTVLMLGIVGIDELEVLSAKSKKGVLYSQKWLYD